MYLLVISKKDTASMNIYQRLLELSDWVTIDELEFDGNEVYKYQDSTLLIIIDKYHLFFDDLDTCISTELNKQGLKINLDTIIFASKHRSASGMKTLTVHPVGNYGKKAEYGGKPEELVPAAPHLMTEAYRILRQTGQALQLPHQVTFEVTHHGPYLETPSFFIEIGSAEDAWGDITAAKAIAKTLITLISRTDSKERFKDFPVAIGVGGGHYAPRHSDVARKKRVSFGHMIPNYALDEISERMLLRPLQRTAGAELVYFHKKALKKDKYRNLKTWYEEHGYKVISSKDLEDI